MVASKDVEEKEKQKEKGVGGGKEKEEEEENEEEEEEEEEGGGCEEGIWKENKADRNKSRTRNSISHFAKKKSKV